MALLAVAGMTIPGVAGFVKDELRRPAAIEELARLLTLTLLFAQPAYADLGPADTVPFIKMERLSPIF